MPKEAQCLTNLDSLGAMVGAYVGIAEGIKEDDYAEQLIRRAHGITANAFDVATASTASATNTLKHVYEFGTAGITPGRVRFSDPTSEKARLYEHVISGSGGRQDIAYVFRPATVPNPQPTTASTGVASKYLAKLSQRKYIFWNKAYVLESGAPVSIKAKHGDYLFVPFYGQPTPNDRNNRGFMMWNSSRLGPIIQQPGATSRGTFTEHWERWWGSTGANLMETEMRKKITADMLEAQRIAQAKIDEQEKLKSVMQTNVATSAGRARSALKKMFGRRMG